MARTVKYNGSQKLYDAEQVDEKLQKAKEYTDQQNAEQNIEGIKTDILNEASVREAADNALQAQIGNLERLKTDYKDNIVESINSLFDDTLRPSDVDAALDPSSANPIRNSVVAEKFSQINDALSDLTVDQELDASSTHPVANKPVTQAINNINTQMTGQIAAINQRISQQRSELDTVDEQLSSRIDINSNNIATLNDRADEVDEDIIAINTEIVNIKAGATSQQSMIQQNSTDILELKSKDDTQDSAISGLDSRITSAEATVSGYDEKIETNASAISALDTKVSGFDDRISTAESDVADLGFKVDEQKRDITKLRDHKYDWMFPQVGGLWDILQLNAPGEVTCVSSVYFKSLDKRSLYVAYTNNNVARIIEYNSPNQWYTIGDITITARVSFIIGNDQDTMLIGGRTGELYYFTNDTGFIKVDLPDLQDDELLTARYSKTWRRWILSTVFKTYYSSDGLNWSVGTTDVTGPHNFAATDIIEVDRKLYANSIYQSYYYTSTDGGMTWTSHALGDEIASSICYDGNRVYMSLLKFSSGQITSKIHYTEDGFDWKGIDIKYTNDSPKQYTIDRIIGKLYAVNGTVYGISGDLSAVIGTTYAERYALYGVLKKSNTTEDNFFIRDYIEDAEDAYRDISYCNGVLLLAGNTPYYAMSKDNGRTIERLYIDKAYKELQDDLPVYCNVAPGLHDGNAGLYFFVTYDDIVYTIYSDIQTLIDNGWIS